MAKVSIKVATVVNGKLKDVADLDDKKALKEILKQIEKMTDGPSQKELDERRKKARLKIECKGEDNGFNVQIEVHGHTIDLIQMIACGAASAYRQLNGTEDDEEMLDDFLELIKDRVVNGADLEDDDEEEDEEEEEDD